VGVYKGKGKGKERRGGEETEGRRGGHSTSRLRVAAWGKQVRRRLITANTDTNHPIQDPCAHTGDSEPSQGLEHWAHTARFLLGCTRPPF